MSYNPKTKKVASLPTKGNELGVYRLDGDQLVFETTVELSHPARDEFEASSDQDMVVYPGFSDIKAFGDYQLIQFYTAVPEDIYNGLRASGENFQSNPEYREAMIKYRKLGYIIVKGDQQIGILNELPAMKNCALRLVALIKKRTVSRDFRINLQLVMHTG